MPMTKVQACALLLAISAVSGLPAAAQDSSGIKWNTSLDHNYRKTYQYYHRVYAEDKRQIREFYVNSLAALAIARGTAMSDGAIIVMEVFGAELGPNGQPVRDRDGKMMLGPLNVISLMETIKGANQHFAKDLANGDWVYFFLSSNFDDKTTPEDRVDCLRCHQKAASSQFIFTREQIFKAVR